MADEYEEIEETEQDELSSIDKTIFLAQSEDDLTSFFDDDELSVLGSDVVRDYKRDEGDREDWLTTAEEAIKSAAQTEDLGTKDYPWPNASNIRYPVLTIGAMQFNARAYPAVVKGDEPVLVKTIGSDKGRRAPQPQMQPQPPAVGPQGPAIDPQGPMIPPQGPSMGQQPQWEVPPGIKAARAARVAEYMNVLVMYRMDDWERDTDKLLFDLPVVGCVFRKLWWNARAGKQMSRLVSAVNVAAPKGAIDVKTASRLTEVRPDVPMYEINLLMRNGTYRDVDLSSESDDEEAPRCLLEQHRLIDLDEDGLPEPYIVTVDKKDGEVLSVRSAFGPEDVIFDGRQVREIDRKVYYVKYDFLPNPEGGFYGLGLGHLLKQVGGVIDTNINMLIDTAHAQAAGGGFLGSGVNLQAGKRGSDVHYEPGKYKPVSVSGTVLRDGIVDLPRPQVSLVSFQVLELMLGAAQEISSAKDVLTGDAKNTGQVGTTLALIEQGLQVYTAIHKRVYRSLKQEYKIIFETIGKYGGQEAAQDYQTILDDPAADFETDFRAVDMDIRPVADPSNVTKMQKIGQAQILLQLVEPIAAAGGRADIILRRALEALDVEAPDEILPEPQPQQPDPAMIAEVEKVIAQTEKLQAEAAVKQGEAQMLPAKAQNMEADTLKKATEAGTEMARA